MGIEKSGMNINLSDPWRPMFILNFFLNINEMQTCISTFTPKLDLIAGKPETLDLGAVAYVKVRCFQKENLLEKIWGSFEYRCD